MSKKQIYFILVLLSFAFGAYAWKVTHTGYQGDITSLARQAFDNHQNGNHILAYVAGEPIMSEDLDFEYTLHTKGVFDSEELSPLPDLGPRYEAALLPLKENLMVEIIERKILTHFIKEDKNFDYKSERRLTTCLREWKKTLAENELEFVKKTDVDLLKNRLCERSIIEQYLEERYLTHLKVSDDEIKEYYVQHEKEFKKPKRVLIRQIVLASELEAKRAQAGLNRRNFIERAKKLSITPEAEEGGLIGPYSKGQMPRVFDVAFVMRPKQIYGILKSTYGFHLILLEKKYPAEKPSLKRAETEIRKILLEKKSDEEYRNWVDLALSSVRVTAPGRLW